ncbi:MAG: hypothetical protein Q9225_007709, partial [Loekoesia sp. 1 TL-2023]
GKGQIIDLGTRNQAGRFFMARYIWSKEDKKRYDQKGEFPLALGTHKDTPVVPVSFVKLAWGQDLEPLGTRSSMYLTRLLENRWPSLVICDMFSHQCIRQPHARFVIPHDQLPPKLARATKIKLKHGVMDQYYVSEDHLVDAILGVLDGSLRTSVGTVLQTRAYCRLLGDAMSGGVGN